jgi:hypothetical protein
VIFCLVIWLRFLEMCLILISCSTPISQEIALAFSRRTPAASLIAKSEGTK